MILDMADDYQVKYIIVKNITSQRRFKTQLDYQLGKQATSIAISESLYEKDYSFDKINFAKLHSDLF